MPVKHDGETERPETNETEQPATSREESSEESPADATEDADAGEDDLALSPDLAFDLLKNERRRRVLYHLEEADGQVTLGDLAEHIAALENDTTIEALTSSERKRVYVGLYQVHLPKMDDAGVIEFDRNRGTVDLAEHADTLTKYLDRGEDDSRPWHRYYGGLSAGSAGLYAGGLAGILPTNLVMGIILTLFIGCSGLHTFERRMRA